MIADVLEFLRDFIELSVCGAFLYRSHFYPETSLKSSRAYCFLIFPRTSRSVLPGQMCRVCQNPTASSRSRLRNNCSFSFSDIKFWNDRIWCRNECAKSYYFSWFRLLQSLFGLCCVEAVCHGGHYSVHLVVRFTVLCVCWCHVV